MTFVNVTPFLAKKGAQIPVPPSNGTATIQPRNSVYFGDGTNNAYYSYTKTAGDALEFPNSDWYFVAQVYVPRTTGTKYIVSLNNIGTVNNFNLQYNGATLQFGGQVRGGGAAFAWSQTGTTAANQWVTVVVQRVGTNIEAWACPLNGTPVNILPATAWSGASAIVPAGTAHRIGQRADGNTTTYWHGFISHLAKGTGSLTSTQIGNLAAMQDIIIDLGLSPVLYTKLEDASATLADSGSGGKTATRTGTLWPRGHAANSNQAITVNDPTKAWGYVYQRAMGGTTKSITFTGTYKGDPTYIQVRVVSSNGTDLTGWKYATYPSAGNWSCTISVPQGGDYSVEARHFNTPSNIARSIRPWGVGIVVLYVGESISEQQTSTNQTESGYTYLEDRIALYSGKTTTWQSAANTSKVIAFNAASRIATATGLPVMIAAAGYSGSELVTDVGNNWSRYPESPSSPGANSPMHVTCINTIAECGGDFEAIYWNQGVNDSQDVTLSITSTQYRDALVDLVKQLRGYSLRGSGYRSMSGAQQTLVNNAIPFISHVVGYINEVPSQPNNIRSVRQGTYDALTLIENSYYGSTSTDLANAAGDPYHPSSTSYIEIGKRWVQGYLRALGISGYNNAMRGGFLSSASNTAGVVTLTFTLTDGTALQGLTGATNITGIKIFDSGGTALTQSVAPAIINATQVQLTVTGGIPATAAYNWAQSEVQTNMLYTNGTIAGSTYGVPIMPTATLVTVV